LKANRLPRGVQAKRRLRNLLGATFEPSSKFPGIFAIMVFLGADKAALVNDSVRVIVSGVPAATVLTAGVSAIYVYLPLALLTQLRIRFKAKLSGAGAFFGATFLAVTASVFLIEATLGPDLRLGFNNEVRLFIAAILVSALVGTYNRKVAADLIASLGLVQKLEQQQAFLIEADEKARREIANLLHDSVQSKLVISATKLNAISSKAPENIALELQQILLDLEKLRRLDVRNASRALSPDISLFGLQGCLSDLASVYNETMKISLDVEDLPKWAEEKYGLAVYRVCEQVFLNALAHGGAKNCEATVRVEKASLLVTIENDGKSLEKAPQPAKGSALIDAWVSRFNGAWSLNDLEDGRVCLEARLKMVSP
jgi:signal transduction histidine kinase